MNNDLTNHASSPRYDQGAPVVGGNEKISTRMVAMLVHDLRNLIAPIRNAIHLMRLSSTGMDVRPIADLIDRQIKDIGRLLETLDEAEQAERGDLKLERAFVSISDLVDEVVRSARPLIERRMQRIYTALPETSIRMHADPKRLMQVLATLVENAAYHTAEGGEIRLEVQVLESEVCIRVLDSGTGIAPEFLPQVFEFFPGRHQPRLSGRTGLGSMLAIAAKIVELHSGRLTVASAGEGKGSEFVVHLPVQGPAPESAGVTQAQASPAAVDTAARPITGRRILIADDNEALRSSFCSLLGHMGHEVRSAVDGIDAVAVAREWLPGLVFIDINMPGLNGFEVARILRSEFPVSAMKLVMMSGDRVDDATQRSALRAGFDACLDKAHDFENLEQLLKNLS